MIKSIFYLFLLSLSFFVISSSSWAYDYQVTSDKEKLFSTFTNVPKDFTEGYSTYFNKKYVPEFSLIASSTLFLWYYDEKILHWSHKMAGKIDREERVKDNKKISFSVGGLPVRVPQNLFTWLYNIGDGFTQSFINAGFYAYGFTANNERAKRTAFQITEGLISTTVLTQFLKQATGRESPKASTTPRGRWRPFGHKGFAATDPSYDAYPSGHVATTLTTLTIIAENYPEYSYIKPLGYTLIGTLAFSMMAIGVHWASDYPLAIGIGIGMGKIISARGKNKEIDPSKSRTEIVPVVGLEGQMGAGLRYHF